MASVSAGSSASESPEPPSTVLDPPASYGPLTARPRADFKPAVTPPASDWKSARYAMLTSELSPAVLYHNRTKKQHLFGGMDRWGLGGPTALAYMGPGPSLQVQSASARSEER
ncbi:MAG: hypothetical protein KY468_19290, partial [Armatimonadetes bacterium]|nr:hypothetical protein [Armatimonadota bacterium]